MSSTCEVRLDDGRSISADAAVLALGNLPPVVPDSLDPDRLGSRYVADPWSPAMPEGLRQGDHVVIVGTGLTMVDVVLLLKAHGFEGRITAISRRGLMPREQAGGARMGESLAERPSGELSGLLREVRARSRAVGWHHAIDELRPFTQAMWQTATLEQRRRFLRHLRPWWDVHRHRVAPAVARQIDALREAGSLQIVAGRTLDFQLRGAGVEIAWRPRGAAEVQQLLADRVINCTGPQSDLTRTEEPLLQKLMRDGAIVPDDLRLGVSVDNQGRLLDVASIPNDRLFALGPMTRGTFWEITAVPDIRVQTWSIARRLSNAHWIGGEGL